MFLTSSAESLLEIWPPVQSMHSILMGSERGIEPTEGTIYSLSSGGSGEAGMGERGSNNGRGDVLSGCHRF